jgi:hypothetical protein
MPKKSEGYQSLLPLFSRAFIQVSLVAVNVKHIAVGDYAMAFLSATALSYVWWANSRSAARDDHPLARSAYSVGAGAGTMFGMWVGGLW